MAKLIKLKDENELCRMLWMQFCVWNFLLSRFLCCRSKDVGEIRLFLIHGRKERSIEKGRGGESRRKGEEYREGKGYLIAEDLIEIVE
jgi:hypothetical protein